MSPRPEPTRQHAILDVEYDGSPFFGWTRQPGGLPTIELALTDGFQAIDCTDVELRCAGRTDAGVHASAQIIDAMYTGTIAPDRVALALIEHLPKELGATASRPAPVGFNARADATSRAYEYRVLNRATPSPLRAGRVLHHPRRLDRALLDAAAAAVLGQHHFVHFTPQKTEHVYFDRTVVTSQWVDRGDELVYEVRANAFLRRMVRMLVGTMLAVGRGENELEQFLAMLEGGPNRDARLQAAQPHGLCLVDVTWEPYPGLPLPPTWRSTR